MFGEQQAEQQSETKDSRSGSSQREEFRKYLEQGGVMEVLTRALSDLFMEKEKPEDPLDYVKCFISEHRRPEGDLSIIRNELITTKEKLKLAEEQVCSLKLRLGKYEDIDASVPVIPPTPEKQ